MRHIFIRAVLPLALVCSTPTWAQQSAPIDPERLAAARELLEVTGATKGAEIMMNAMSKSLLQLFSNANPGKEKEVSIAFDLLLKRMLGRAHEMLELTAPLYAERFSTAELKEAIAFYKSPTGAKFIATQPQILEQSIAIGQSWGRQIGEEFRVELTNELRSRGLNDH
jgi:uncharacterized protein